MANQFERGATLILAALAMVETLKAVVKAAQAAGAKVEMPVQDMFWGDRAGSLMDPFGHRWWVATHVEDLTPEQMGERHKKAFANAK